MDPVSQFLAASCLNFPPPSTVAAADVDAWRRRISLKVEEVQGLIESSKFEPRAAGSEEVVRITSAAQNVFLVLLALARHRTDWTAVSETILEAMQQFEMKIAQILAAAAEQIQGRGTTGSIDIEGTIGAVERSVYAHVAPSRDVQDACLGRIALYWELVAAVKRVERATQLTSIGFWR